MVNRFYSVIKCCFLWSKIQFHDLFEFLPFGRWCAFFVLSFSLPFSSWYPSILSIKKFYWDFKCKYSCICLRSTIATGQTENFQQACKQKMSCYWKRAQILTKSLFCINNGCGSFCKYWNNWTSLPISAKLQNAIRFDEKFTSIKEQCANLLKFLNSSWSMYVAKIIWAHRAEIPVQIGHGRISSHIFKVPHKDSQCYPLSGFYSFSLCITIRRHYTPFFNSMQSSSYS